MHSYEQQHEDQYAKLLQKGFYIEKATRPITLNTEPRDGCEFIHKARLEDALVNLDPLEDLNNTNQAYPDPVKDTNLFFRKQTEAFAHLAMALKSRKEMLIKKFPKRVEFPDLEPKAWCHFCLGSKLYAEIYPEEPLVEEKRAHKPLLSILLHLDQLEIMILIIYHFTWFKMIGMNDDIGRWLYALCMNLQKPLEDKHQKQLEKFHDFTEKVLNTLEGSERDRVHLILSILKHYFGVKYYLEGIPIDRYIDKSYYWDSTSSE